jgi:hypothetical protein
MSWDAREYFRKRAEFLSVRGRHHPMLAATTLIFVIVWLVGWGSSAALLRFGRMHSMPLRYALGFVAAYAAFFLCVRAWCQSVATNRGEGRHLDLGGGDLPVDPEGCLPFVALAFAAFLVACLFWASGGYAALLEAAFEVAFAGTVVRRLSRTEIVGDWGGALFANSWPQALAALLVLIGIASVLQHAAPDASTFAQAVRQLGSGRAASR